MKKILSILLLIALCFTFTVPAFADEGDFIIDDAGLIYDYEEFDKLENKANEVFLNQKFAVCFGSDDVAYDGEIEEAAKEFFENKIAFYEGINLYVNTATRAIYVYATGNLEDEISGDAYTEMLNAYNHAGTEFEGISAYLEKAEEVLSSLENKPLILKAYFMDSEELVTGDDFSEVMTRLIEVSDKHQFDVIGLSKAIVGDYAAKEAADYFEDNQYGYGESRDGIILLISKESNHEGIAALGRGESMFPDEIMDYILDEVDVYRLNGQYKEAYLRYADLIEQELENPGTLKAAKQARDDAEAKANMPMRIVKEVVVALVLGFLLAFIPTGVMSSKMNSVHMQNNASNYMVPGSMNVRTERDIFLYNTVTKTKRVKQNSSSGGGGGRASSGRSFSGSSR